LKKLVEVDFSGTNICIDANFHKSDSSISTMNQKLQNCYNNCLMDEECKLNIEEVKTASIVKLPHHETEYVHLPEFELFKNQTLIRTADLKHFFSIEINKVAGNLMEMEKKVDSFLTSDKFISELKKSDLIKNIEKLVLNLAKTTNKVGELTLENASLRKQLDNQQDELQKVMDQVIFKFSVSEAKETKRHQDCMSKNAILEEKLEEIRESIPKYEFYY
jgi:hypothetical protein